MVKVCKLVTCGAPGVGKTAFLEKLVNNRIITQSPGGPTNSNNSNNSNNHFKAKNTRISKLQKTGPSYTSNSSSSSTGSNTKNNSNSNNNNSTSNDNNSNSNTPSETNHSIPSSSSEDIYLCNVNTERGPVSVRIHDTSGQNWSNKSTSKSHYCHFGDGFLIFYDMSNLDSFKIVDYIKNEIVKERDRREIFIMIVGMKSDMSHSGSRTISTDGESMDSSKILNYLESEKLTHFECTINNRGSLSKPISEMINRMTLPVQKGGWRSSTRTY